MDFIYYFYPFEVYRFIEIIFLMINIIKYFNLFQIEADLLLVEK